MADKSVNGSCEIPKGAAAFVTQAPTLPEPVVKVRQNIVVAEGMSMPARSELKAIRSQKKSDN